MKSFTAVSPPSHEGETNWWFTPRYITKQLGEFDLDPCSNSKAPVYHAKNNWFMDYFYKEEGKNRSESLSRNNQLSLLNNSIKSNGEIKDALNDDWFGRVWLNPPYGKTIGRYLDKLYTHGNGIALVFSRTDTKIMQRHLKLCDAVFFLEKRISHIGNKSRSNGNAGIGSMFLIYGKENIKSVMGFSGVLFKND